jgi:hypothetical protein
LDNAKRSERPNLATSISPFAKEAGDPAHATKHTHHVKREQFKGEPKVKACGTPE